AYEYSVEELRVVFTAAASTLDRVRAFRAQRLARIDSGDSIIPLAADPGRLVLHLAPLSSFGIGPQFDLAPVANVHAQLRPMNSLGFNSSYNFDGLANVYHRDGACSSYTQVFRNGTIEAVMVGLVAEVGDKRLLQDGAIGKYIFEILPGYMSA